MTASNAAGIVVSDKITVMTLVAGEQTSYVAISTTVKSIAPFAASAFVKISVLTSSNITIKWSNSTTIPVLNHSTEYKYIHSGNGSSKQCWHWCNIYIIKSHKCSGLFVSLH